MKFKFQKFTKADYATYQQWFEDKDLKKALGGVDKTWLNYILTDNTGTELAIFRQGKMVAVVGLVFPDEKDDYYVISNFAVDPALKNQGLGSEILEALIEYFPKGKKKLWVCYVEKSNLNGQRFFEKNGWKQKETTDMIRYEYLEA